MGRLQEALQSAGIGIPIIFMTAHGDVPMIRQVMKAGAVEFLTKPFQKEEFLRAVEQAFTFDRERRAEESVRANILARIASLSGREREIIAMVIGGFLNKQIAAELGLSEITVKLHRCHVMEKMGVDSLVGLVRMCERVKLPAWKDT